MIITMPVLFDKQLYPFGGPMPAADIYVNGTTVEQRFVRMITRDNMETYAEDEEICKDYLLYWANAPCFTIEEDISKIQSLNFNDLYDLLLDNGIDPF